MDTGLVKLLPLHTITDEYGVLVVADSPQLPFPVQRIFYIYDAQGSRGHHAHHTLEQVAVCLRGSCTMVLDDGEKQARHRMDNPAEGLLLEKMVWHAMHDFSEDCVLLVLSSAPYDEADYIRDYDEFKKIVSQPPRDPRVSHHGVTPCHNAAAVDAAMDAGLVKRLPLHTVAGDRGALVVAENAQLPFPIRRVFYMYDVPGSRGHHAHHEIRELAVCLRGSCTMALDNGKEQTRVRLDNPTEGLLLESMVWREMHDFSEDCLLLVLASAPYDAADYIRDYDEFKRIVSRQS